MEEKWEIPESILIQKKMLCDICNKLADSEGFETLEHYDAKFPNRERKAKACKDCFNKVKNILRE